ncbi:hypothetical protein LINGRAHAP2_LOCUS2113 [Linum grandiflorum]
MPDKDGRWWGSHRCRHRLHGSVYQEEAGSYCSRRRQSCHRRHPSHCLQKLINIVSFFI